MRIHPSESEDDRPARDRRTLQERERDDRDLNERKACHSEAVTEQDNNNQ